MLLSVSAGEFNICAVDGLEILGLEVLTLAYMLGFAVKTSQVSPQKPEKKRILEQNHREKPPLASHRHQKLSRHNVTNLAKVH